MKICPNWTRGGFILVVLLLTFSPSSALATPPVQEDDPKAQADRLFNEGNELFQSSQYQSALEKYEAALLLYQKADVELTR